MASSALHKTETNPGFISVRDMLIICRSRWYWFAVTLIIAITVAFFYIKRTAPTYSRTTTIMLIDGKENRHSEINLESLGLESQSSSLIDEMEMLQSPILMQEVVRRLHLNIEYVSQGRFHDVLLYGNHSPLRITITGDSIIQNGSFHVFMVDENNVELQFNSQEDRLLCSLNTLVSTPFGEMLISPTSYYSRFCENYKDLLVKISSNEQTAFRFISRLNVSVKKDKSSIINVTLHDYSTQRAEDVLNTLILVYDENCKESHNRAARNTSDFLDERLEEIGSELGAFDEDVSSYKGSNLIPNVSAAQGIYMSKSSETDSRLQSLSMQLSMLRSIRNDISGSMGYRTFLPTDLGLDDRTISSQISAYNELLLRRDEMVANSGADHPKVQQVDRQIEAMGKAIHNSIDSYEASLSSQIAGLRQVASVTAGRIASSTRQEKHLMSIERQQKVKEQLYVFLLQEKEKSSMQQAYVSSNIRTLQTASGSNAPIAPLTRSIYLMAIAIALGVPFVILFLIEVTDTKIRGRGDLESLAAPYLGEIPKVRSLRQPWYRKRKRRKQCPKIVFDQIGENVVSESIRTIRANLDFILHPQNTSRVIMLTSLGPDSGKTFLSANLAVSVAQLGKKVLIMDLDLRRHTLSHLFEKRTHDISDYLRHSVEDIDEIITTSTFEKNLDAISVRRTPPNPSELLHDPRFSGMIQNLRQRYDYIFLDCPPVGLVSDPLTITSTVDLSILVIRSGKVDKDCLTLIDSFYNEKKLTNLCVMLNDTPIGQKYGSSRYGYYGYGYSSYGYDYKYSDNNNEESSQPS